MAEPMRPTRTSDNCENCILNSLKLEILKTAQKFVKRWQSYLVISEMLSGTNGYCSLYTLFVQPRLFNVRSSCM